MTDKKLVIAAERFVDKYEIGGSARLGQTHAFKAGAAWAREQHAETAPGSAFYLDYFHECVAKLGLTHTLSSEGLMQHFDWLFRKKEAKKIAAEETGKGEPETGMVVEECDVYGIMALPADFGHGHIYNLDIAPRGFFKAEMADLEKYRRGPLSHIAGFEHVGFASAEDYLQWISGHHVPSLDAEIQRLKQEVDTANERHDKVKAHAAEQQAGMQSIIDSKNEQLRDMAGRIIEARAALNRATSGK